MRVRDLILCFVVLVTTGCISAENLCLEVPTYDQIVEVPDGTLVGAAIFRNGISIGIGGEVFLDLALPLRKGIVFNGTGELHLLSDLRCSTDFSISSTGAPWNSGVISGNGHTILLDGDCKINGFIVIKSDTVIDGCLHSLKFGKCSGLVVNSGVSLTLRSMKIENENLSYPLKCLGYNSSITLDGVLLNLSQDWEFARGKLLIKSACVSGPKRFIYSSTSPSLIDKHGLLAVTGGAELRFEPFDGVDPVESRRLLSGVDDTSVLMLNSATLSSSSPGLIFDRGTVLVDNDVKIISDGQDEETGISLCNVKEMRESTMKLLAAAHVELHGYLKGEL